MGMSFLNEGKEVHQEGNSEEIVFPTASSLGIFGSVQAICTHSNLRELPNGLNRHWSGTGNSCLQPQSLASLERTGSQSRGKRLRPPAKSESQTILCGQQGKRVPKTAGKERDRFLGPAPGSFHWLPRRHYQGNPQNRKMGFPGKDKRQGKGGGGRRPDVTVSLKGVRRH